MFCHFHILKATWLDLTFSLKRCHLVATNLKIKVQCPYQDIRTKWVKFQDNFRTSVTFQEFQEFQDNWEPKQWFDTLSPKPAEIVRKWQKRHTTGRIDAVALGATGCLATNGCLGTRACCVVVVVCDISLNSTTSSSSSSSSSAEAAALSPDKSSSKQGWLVFAEGRKSRFFHGKNRTRKNTFCRQK